MWRVTLASRLALSIVAIFALLITPLNNAPGRMDGFNGAELSGWADRLLGVWTRWDGQFYLKIVAVGHNPGDNSMAFYPLYPALVKLLGTVLFFFGNLRYIVAAEVLAAAAFVAALLVLQHATRDLFGDDAADKTILYVAAFPTAFFFWAVYAESLFLLLAVGSVYAARKHRWWLAGLLGGLSVCTRSIGVAVLLALLVEAVVQVVKARRASRAANEQGAANHAPTSQRQAIVHNLRTIIPALALAGIGLISLLTYYQLRVGNAFGFASVQQNWLRRPSVPWDAVWRGIVAAAQRPLQYDAAAQSLLNIACTLIFLLLAVVAWWKLPLSYSTYLSAGLLLGLLNPASAEPLLSQPRFVLVLFPSFMLLGALGRRSRSFHLCWLAVSLLLLGLLFSRFANWWFVA